MKSIITVYLITAFSWQIDFMILMLKIEKLRVSKGETI